MTYTHKIDWKKNLDLFESLIKRKSEGLQIEFHLERMAYWLPIHLENSLRNLERDSYAYSSLFESFSSSLPPSHPRIIFLKNSMKEFQNDIDGCKMAKERLRTLLELFKPQISPEPLQYNPYLIILEEALIEGELLYEQKKNQEAKKLFREFSKVFDTVKSELLDTEESMVKLIHYAKIMLKESFLKYGSQSRNCLREEARLNALELQFEKRRCITKRLQAIRDEYGRLRAKLIEKSETNPDKLKESQSAENKTSKDKDTEEITIDELSLDEDDAFSPPFSKRELISWEQILDLMEKLIKLSASEKNQLLKVHLDSILHSIPLYIKKEQELINEKITNCKKSKAVLKIEGSPSEEFEIDHAKHLKVQKKYMNDCIHWCKLKLQNLKDVAKAFEQMLSAYQITISVKGKQEKEYGFNPLLLKLEKRMLLGNHHLSKGNLKECNKILDDFPKFLKEVKADFNNFHKELKDLIKATEQLQRVQDSRLYTDQQESPEAYLLDLLYKRFHNIQNVLDRIETLKRNYIEFQKEHMAQVEAQKLKKSISETGATETEKPTELIVTIPQFALSETRTSPLSTVKDGSGKTSQSQGIVIKKH